MFGPLWRLLRRVTQLTDGHRLFESMRDIGERNFDPGVIQRGLDRTDNLVLAFPTRTRRRSAPLRPSAHLPEHHRCREVEGRCDQFGKRFNAYEDRAATLEMRYESMIETTGYAARSRVAPSPASASVPACLPACVHGPVRVLPHTSAALMPHSSLSALTACAQDDARQDRAARG